jgi:hypothetical protein
VSRSLDVESLLRRIEQKTTEYSVDALASPPPNIGEAGFVFGRHSGVVLGFRMVKEIIAQMIKEADDERRPKIGQPRQGSAY